MILLLRWCCLLRTTFRSASNFKSSGSSVFAFSRSARTCSRIRVTSSGEGIASIASASAHSSSSRRRVNISSRSGSSPCRQLANCRRSVVIMKLTLWLPCKLRNISAWVSRSASWSSSCSVVKATSTVCGRRMVNSPISRRRVLLIIPENVWSASISVMSWTRSSGVMRPPAKCFLTRLNSGLSFRIDCPQAVEAASSRASFAICIHPISCARAASTAWLMKRFGSAIWLKLSSSKIRSGRRTLRRTNRSWLRSWIGVAVRKITASEFSQKNRTASWLAVPWFRIWCASSTMTRSKFGSGSKSKSPFSLLRLRFPSEPKRRSLFNKEYGRIAFLYCSGHSPSRCISLMQCCSFFPSRCSKFSSNRFISRCHFCSDTKGRGHIMRTDSISVRACNSLKIKPASIVFPTPTLSAISNLGRSALMNFRTGRYW